MNELKTGWTFSQGNKLIAISERVNSDYEDELDLLHKYYNRVCARLDLAEPH